MWGQLRIIQRGHLKIRGDWEKLKYEGAYKVPWGFEKIEEARLSGGLLQRGVLLNRIPCGSLICTASVDFICWNCAFDIVICLFLDLDSMFAQFFQTRLQ